MSILKNALQAVGDEGVVSIKSRADEQNIQVVMRDNGCGIAERNLSRTLDLFCTMRQVGEETGLGLSFAHDTIAKHSGEVSVVSEPDQGSTFTITLPTDRQSDSVKAKASCWLKSPLLLPLSTTSRLDKEPKKSDSFRDLLWRGKE